MSGRHQSIVKHWNAALRYGYVAAPADYQRDIYLSHTDVVYQEGLCRDPRVGDTVEFEFAAPQLGKPWRAAKVRVIINAR